MTSVSDAFGLPFKDPQWFSKLAIQGLIGIIPIVGWIAGAGWVLMTLDNYRAGRYELASPGFHLERGLPLFGVLFVYGLVVGIVGSIFSHISTGLGYVVQIALDLGLAFLTPTIILAVDQGGFGGGFDVAGVFNRAMAASNASVMAIVANIIGGLGIILCCIGLIVSVPYSYAVMAAIAVWIATSTGGAPMGGYTPPPGGGYTPPPAPPPPGP